MKKTYHLGNYRPRLPLIATAVLWLFYDRYEWPDFVAGVLALFIVIIWITAIINVIKSDKVDILDENGKLKRQ